MSELETLQRLERETGLLAMGGDVEQMRRSSYEFTRRAQVLLRREGWRLLKAPPGGNAIDGVRIDKIINASTLQIADIIVNSDDPGPEAPRRAATWQIVDTGRATDVVNDGGGADVPEPPPPPPPPPVVDPDDLLVLALKIDHLIDVAGQVAAALDQANDNIKRLEKDGIRVRLR